MASEEVLDFDQLLAPIPGDDPTGKDSREDLSPTSTYREVRAARAEARQAERRGVFDDEEESGPPPDWKPIVQLSTKLIAEESKDLEVVALLIEGLVRLEGAVGLRDGFRLARELCQRYWDDLYPMPDEEGVLTRVAPLAGLNGEDSDGLLLSPIGKLLITAGTTEGPFSWTEYRMALDLERIDDPDKLARRMAAPGLVTRQMFDAAVAETSREFVEHLLDDISGCVDEFTALTEVLEEQCGDDDRGFSMAPPSSNIRTALTELGDDVQTIFRDLLAPEEEAEGEDGGAGGPSSSASISGREDAFQTLMRVADFFKRTEPHSPVSYALEQAVRWGRMPLPELLEELVEDSSARYQLYKLVGIKPPEE